MEKLMLSDQDFEMISDVVKSINVEMREDISETIGCTGCEGGCANALCAG